MLWRVYVQRIYSLIAKDYKSDWSLKVTWKRGAFLLLYSNTKVNKYSSCYLFLSLSGRWFILIKHTESATGGVPYEKVFLEISQNSLENTCARDSFLIKVQAWNFIKEGSLAQVFPVNFAKFLRTSILQNITGQLLLNRLLLYCLDLLFTAICH